MLTDGIEILTCLDENLKFNIIELGRKQPIKKDGCPK